MVSNSVHYPLTTVLLPSGSHLTVADTELYSLDFFKVLSCVRKVNTQFRVDFFPFTYF